jgi:hypothetical protein
MEFWRAVRRQVLTGELSRRAACRKHGLGWHTLKKILSHEEPPGYRQSQRNATRVALPNRYQMDPQRSQDRERKQPQTL